MKYIKDNITTEESKDAGLALTLLSLFVAYKYNTAGMLLLPAILLILCMTIPGIFRPFGRIWYGLSALLGTVVSRVILTLVFWVVVTPVGVIRRLLGNDPLQLTAWKKGSGSVFRVTDRTIIAEDMKNPY